MSKWSAAYRDSRWQKKRLEVMNRDEWTCRSCGASGDGVTLNVHHIYYESGKAPWDYENEMLITWCENCHYHVHGLTKTIQHLIATNGGYDLVSELVGYIHGIIGSKTQDAPNYNRGFVCGVYSNNIRGGVK